MHSKNFLINDEAVSISIGFILMFSVSVLVFTALVLSFYSIYQDTEKSAMQASFKIIGSEISEKITTFDMIVNSINSSGGEVNSLEYEFSLPGSIAGKSYTMNITNSPYQIIMESDNGARSVSPFNITINITERKIYSGSENYKFKYDTNNRSIIIDED